MASRRYLTNAAPSYTPATIRGSWDNTTGDGTNVPVVKQLGASKSGAAAIVSLEELSATNLWDVLWGRWISEPVAGGSLSGTVTWMAAVIESVGTMNAFYHVHVYATSGASDTVQGTLLANNIGATEFPLAHTGRGEGAKTITTTTLAAGDRVVFEVGYQAQNTATQSRIAEIVYGGTGATDLTSGSTDVINQPGWVEFSDPNNVLDAFTPTSALTYRRPRGPNYRR